MSEDTGKLSGFPYVVGGLSFIPLIGVIFGIAAIVWGLITKKRGGKKLAWIGASGITLTFILYGSLFYFGFVQRGGMYDDLRKQLAQGLINSLVPAVETYKLQNGSYPESLEQLRQSLPKNSFINVYDPSMPIMGSSKSPFFFYERVGDDHYYLRGVGPDGQPFTADDLLPAVDHNSAKLGLLIEPPVQK